MVQVVMLIVMRKTNDRVRPKRVAPGPGERNRGGHLLDDSQVPSHKSAPPYLLGVIGRDNGGAFGRNGLTATPSRSGQMALVLRSSVIAHTALLTVVR